MIIEESGTTPEGYPYIVVVKYDTGHRNGYVGLFEDSPLYKKRYNPDYDDDEEYEQTITYDVSVHGGLTYSGFLGMFVVGGDNPWWFGFDCNHLDDRVISVDDIERIVIGSNRFTGGEIVKIVERYTSVYEMMDSKFSPGATTKSRDFVYNNCMELSKQLKELEGKFNVDD